MDLMIEILIRSAGRILISVFPPFFWWVGRSRKSGKFFESIGFKGMDKGGSYNSGGWIIGTSLLSIVSSFMLLNMTLYSNSGIFIFSGGGIGVLPSLLIYAIITTSLPEEIFFRGFLLKRLSSRLGFGAANIIQSILFGLLHGFLVFTEAGVVKSVHSVILIAIIGWLLGYINEEKARGSILPSWGIHAITVIYAGICTAFGLYYY